MAEVIIFVLFFMSVIAHEVAHGWAALKLGDPTAKHMNRLTFNPVPHIDLFMTIIIPLVIFVLSGFRFIFGGAKPVPINPMNFKKPDRDMMITSIAGPLTNILIGIFFSIILVLYVYLAGPKEGIQETLGFRVFFYVTFINYFLVMFNLIPIPPLDGSRVLRYFMPNDIKNGMDRFEPYGMLAIVAVLVSPLGDPIFDVFYSFMNWYFKFIFSGLEFVA